MFLMLILGYVKVRRALQGQESGWKAKYGLLKWADIKS